MTEKLDALISGTVLPGTFVAKSAEILGPDLRVLLLNKAATTATRKLMPQIAKDLRKDFLAHSAFKASFYQSLKPGHRATLKNGEPVSPRQKQAFDRTNMGVDGYDGMSGLLRGIEMKEAAQPLLAEQMGRNRFFLEFDTSQSWRLFVDAEHQQEFGDYRYENESGYMAGMMNSYRQMLSTLHEPVSADLLLRLHTTAVDGVLKRGETERSANLARELGVIDPELDSFMTKGFRDGRPNHFGLVVGLNCSEAGLEELMDLSDDYSDFTIRTDGKKQLLFTEPRSATLCKSIATRIFDEYDDEIRTARSTDQKLMAIARCCRDLEASHLFMDGNARTIGFVLLNGLLMRNGLPPAAMADPSVFDGFSISECAGKIAIGQQNFVELQQMSRRSKAAI